jgi:hypothetical protein
MRLELTGDKGFGVLLAMFTIISESQKSKEEPLDKSKISSPILKRGKVEKEKRRRLDLKFEK